MLTLNLQNDPIKYPTKYTQYDTHSAENSETMRPIENVARLEMVLSNGTQASVAYIMR